MDDMAAQVDAHVQLMFRMAREQFGPVISGYWVHEQPGCPGCGGEIGAVEIDGKPAVSLNAYFFRPRGLIIGYLLCGSCAETIHLSASKMPGRQTALHATIERHLEAAYRAYLGKMTA